MKNKNKKEKEETIEIKCPPSMEMMIELEFRIKVLEQALMKTKTIPAKKFQEIANMIQKEYQLTNSEEKKRDKLLKKEMEELKKEEKERKSYFG